MPSRLPLGLAMAIGLVTAPASLLAVQSGQTTQSAPPDSAAAAGPQDAQPPEGSPGPRRLTVVDELRRRDELRWQRAEARMEDAARQAREAMDAKRFDEARTLADKALAIIESARIYAEPVSRYEAARAVAERLREEVRAAAEAWEAERTRQQQREIAEQVARRRELQEQQRREKVQQLLSTAEQLRLEQRYREAAEVMRQVLFIDPTNAQARHQLTLLEDFASLREQSELHEAYRSESRASLVDAEEAKIPWHHDIMYPRNWLEITARRSGAPLGTRPDEDRELNRRLELNVPQVDFEQVPLEQALEQLSQAHQINLSVDWNDLESAGVRRDQPVSLKLSDVTLGTVLSEVLSQLGGQSPVAHAVGDGLIRIATREKLDRAKFSLVYDIRDLLVETPRYQNAAKLLPGATQTEVNEAARGAGAASAEDGRWTVVPRDQREEERDDGKRRALAQQIMDIIRETVEPGSWRENGGDGAMRELNGQLIIYNTSAAHQQVTDLLSQLRETRALQIAVEARFLVVTSNFLEEIGVDLDFVFNQGSAGFDPAFTAGGAQLVDPFTGAPVLIPRPFSRIGATPAIPAGGQGLPQTGILQPYGQAGLVPTGTGIPPQANLMTPITAQQGSLGLVNPTQLNTGVPGSIAQRGGFAPALNIAGSYLDNLQIDFLIRATQANSRSSVVQAPRLLLPNSGRANVAVFRARSYVSSLTPSVAEGAVGVTPVFAAANSGVTLDVSGVISADRRYVTLDVLTTLSQEPRFERFEVQRGSGNSPGLFVLLPDQEFRTISTQVTVPDGGTVLLGGLKQSGEVEIDAGVPILSKIPVLKRAFTNSSIVKDTQTLLILLKTKILIQNEAEEEAFPTLSATAAGG